MSKQDRQGVRTAADLERKYDFGSIGKGGGGGDSQQFSKIEQALSQYKTSTDRKLNELENKIENSGGGSSGDIDYSLIEFDTSEIVVTPSDKILSHVGMIIHSSVLDTMEKVIAVYGGTTWKKIEGRFLIGQSSSYAIGSEGGEATHALSMDEMPSHRHDVVARITKGHGGAPAYSSIGTLAEWWLDSSPSIGETTYSGGGQPHNNMPPYKTVYIWERTA